MTVVKRRGNLERVMTYTRRGFLSTTIAAGAYLAGRTTAFGIAAAPSWASNAGKRILILGGTGFLGPKIVDAAKARGHALTLFNRGRTEKRIGVIEGVEKRYGNRDPNLPADEAKDDQGNYVHPSPRGLEQLADGEWDAVVDTSGQYPRIVKASAELLGPRVKQYIYISSLSAYADNLQPNMDETAAVAKLADPTVETMGASFENYGGLKALCEQAAETAMPGRVTTIRPGLIVGPGDPTDRFTYWPLRVKKGGEILAPGTPDDPVQMVDVRDLAEWIIVLIENGTTGVFNASGPAPGELTMGETLEGCRRASRSDARFTWVPAAFLEKQNVSAWMDMPLWVPPMGDSAGFHLRSTRKAVASGLKFRPVDDTAGAILEWWSRELERRTRVTEQFKQEARDAGKPEPQMPDPGQLRAGIRPEREVEVLTAWHQQENAAQSDGDVTE